MSLRVDRPTVPNRDTVILGNRTHASWKITPLYEFLSLSDSLRVVRGMSEALQNNRTRAGHIDRGHPYITSPIILTAVYMKVVLTFLCILRDVQEQFAVSSLSGREPSSLVAKYEAIILIRVEIIGHQRNCQLTYFDADKCAVMCGFEILRRLSDGQKMSQFQSLSRSSIRLPHLDVLPPNDHDLGHVEGEGIATYGADIRS